MLINGPINVFPSLVKEYSTAMDFDFVTRLAINPADSRSRRFFVSMRWDTVPRRRRNWPWRWGPSLREAKILTVHLPMKIVEILFDSGPGCFFIFALAGTMPGQDRFWFDDGQRRAPVA